LTTAVGMQYFPVAIAQGMAQPLMCSSANEATGQGSPSIQGAGYSNVLHTYCGQCIQFTTDDGTTVGGVVFDTCPYAANSEWCSKDGNANQHGFHNHLDIYGSTSIAVTNAIGDNPTGRVQTITCPSAVINALTSLASASQQSPQSKVCSWYWDGSHWQGSPGMSDFGCSECSNTRRLKLKDYSQNATVSVFKNTEGDDDDDAGVNNVDDSEAGHDAKDAENDEKIVEDLESKENNSSQQDWAGDERSRFNATNEFLV